jgi:microsomal epoxide hydrolase
MSTPETKVEGFSIDVEQAMLEDLRNRLRRTRWPSGLQGAGWERGTDLGQLRDLCGYWADGFDWRAQEKALNELTQVVAEVDGLATHAVHVRSPEPHAVPLILMHGWPSTFAEFRTVVAPLADPRAYGGDPCQAFHVVCPSLPGYGFSAAPQEPGWDVRRVGRHLGELMTMLGYDRFAAQGGDWGAMAAHSMALDIPERLIGIHLNLVLAYPPDSADAMDGLSDAELARARRFGAMNAAGGINYALLQGMSPHTLSPALSDSPAGLAAWITEKFHAWTQHDGQVSGALSWDELLTHLTIYWVTNCLGSSIELYFESTRTGTMGPPPARVKVPTGGALLPYDMLAPARKWAEPLFNIVRWTEFEGGGHFPAMERPAEFVDDVRAFFAPLR